MEDRENSVSITPEVLKTRAEALETSTVAAVKDIQNRLKQLITSGSWNQDAILTLRKELDVVDVTQSEDWIAELSRYQNTRALLNDLERVSPPPQPEVQVKPESLPEQGFEGWKKVIDASEPIKNFRQELGDAETDSDVSVALAHLRMDLFNSIRRGLENASNIAGDPAVAIENAQKLAYLSQVEKETVAVRERVYKKWVADLEDAQEMKDAAQVLSKPIPTEDDTTGDLITLEKAAAFLGNQKTEVQVRTSEGLQQQSIPKYSEYVQMKTNEIAQRKQALMDSWVQWLAKNSDSSFAPTLARGKYVEFTALLNDPNSDLDQADVEELKSINERLVQYRDGSSLTETQKSHLNSLYDELKKLSEQIQAKVNEKKEKTGSYEELKKQVYDQLEDIEGNKYSDKTLEEEGGKLTAPRVGWLTELKNLAITPEQKLEAVKIETEVGNRLSLHWTYMFLSPLIQRNPRTFEGIPASAIPLKMDQIFYFINQSERLNGDLNGVPVVSHDVMTTLGPVRMDIRETMVGKVMIEIDRMLAGKTRFGVVTAANYHEREDEVLKYLKENITNGNTEVARTAMRLHMCLLGQSHDSATNPGLSDVARKMLNMFQYFMEYGAAQKDEEFLGQLPGLLWGTTESNSEIEKLRQAMFNKIGDDKKLQAEWGKYILKPPFRLKCVRSAAYESAVQPGTLTLEESEAIFVNNKEGKMEPKLVAPAHWEAGFMHPLRYFRIATANRRDGGKGDFSFYNIRDSKTEDLMYWLMPFAGVDDLSKAGIQIHPDVARSAKSGEFVVENSDYKSYMMDFIGNMSSFFKQCFMISPKDALGKLMGENGTGNLNKAIDDNLASLSGAREWLVQEGVDPKVFRERRHKGEEFTELKKIFRMFYVLGVLLAARQRTINVDVAKLKTAILKAGFLDEDAWEVASRIGINLPLDILRDMGHKLSTTLEKG